MIVNLDDGTKLTIPFSTDDISFADFCDFKAKEAAFIDEIKEDFEYGLPEVIEQIVKGDITNIPYSIENESIITLIENDFFFEFDNEISIGRLYAHIITLLKRVDIENLPKSKTQILIHGADEKYVIDSVRAVRLMTETNLTAGEMVETLEFQRRFLAVRENANLQDVASIDFELGLTEVAILCRKEDEKLPHRKVEFDEWLKKRVTDIQKIPLTDVLRIRFFLLSCLIDFVQTESTVTSLKANQIFTKRLNARITNPQLKRRR